MVTIFHESPGTILSPVFRNTLNAGLQSFVFTRWWSQYMEREHAKHMLKTRFYSNYLTRYMALILKVVWNLF